MEYCVYQQDNACILKDIEVNALGMCDNCEIVSPNHEFLAAAKKRRLDEIAEK
jgi:hypothetical protein